MSVLQHEHSNQGHMNHCQPNQERAIALLELLGQMRLRIFIVSMVMVPQARVVAYGVKYEHMVCKHEIMN